MDNSNSQRPTEPIPVPQTGRELMLARRRKMLSQYEMAAYLGMTRDRLRRIEAGQSKLPDAVAFEAQRVLSQHSKDCFNMPEYAVLVLRHDGFSYRQIADESGIAVTRVKVIARGLARPTAAELDALLNVPTRPEIRRRGSRGKGRKSAQRRPNRMAK